MSSMASIVFVVVLKNVVGLQLQHQAQEHGCGGMVWGEPEAVAPSCDDSGFHSACTMHEHWAVQCCLQRWLAVSSAPNLLAHLWLVYDKIGGPRLMCLSTPACVVGSLTWPGLQVSVTTHVESAIHKGGAVRTLHKQVCASSINSHTTMPQQLSVSYDEHQLLGMELAAAYQSLACKVYTPGAVCTALAQNSQIICPCVKALVEYNAFCPVYARMCY